MCDAAQRVGVGERTLELGVDDRVDVARFVASGVADGLLALRVGPAGAVGDQLAVVADEEPADDLSESAELCVRGVDQAGADVVPEPEVAPGGVGLAGSRVRSALLVLGGRVAELVVVDAGTREVGILAGRGRVAFADVFVDEVEDECRIDDPDPGGEVLPAVVDVCVAAVAGSVAGVSGDADLQRSRLCASGERVELCGVSNQALLALEATAAHKHQVLSRAIPLDAPRYWRASPSHDSPSPALIETLTSRRDTATDPELRLLVREELISVRRALPSLTASERAGLAMAVNGHSPTRLAATLPGSPHAASQAAHRARRKLAAALAA